MRMKLSRGSKKVQYCLSPIVSKNVFSFLMKYHYQIITWPLVPPKNFSFENLNFGNPCVRICKIVFAAAWGAAGSLDTWSWSGHGTLSPGLCKHSVYKYNFRNWTNTFWSWRNKTTLRSILCGKHWHFANQYYELWMNDDIHDNNCTKKMFTFFKSSSISLVSPLDS